MNSTPAKILILAVLSTALACVGEQVEPTARTAPDADVPTEIVEQPKADAGAEPVEPAPVVDAGSDPVIPEPTGDAGAEPAPVGDGGTDPVVLPEESTIADERGTASVAFDVYPVRVTTAVLTDSNMAIITVQDPTGGDSSGLVAVIPETLPTAATVKAGDCVHLVGTFDETNLRLVASALDIFDCGEAAAPPVNADGGEGFVWNAEMDNRFDSNAGVDLPSFDGQLVSYSTYPWRAKGLHGTYVDAVIIPEADDTLPQNRVRLVPGSGSMDELVALAGADVVLTGVHVTNYPNINDPLGQGIGPALVVTSITGEE
jgi:hypothetical protein